MCNNFSRGVKESLLKLDNHQWSVAWFGYCPKREQFQIHSLHRELTAYSQLLSCTIVDTKQSSGDSGCTIVLLSFPCALQWISIQYLQILWISCYCMLLFFLQRCLNWMTTLTNFNFQFSASDDLQLLMTSASGRHLLMRVFLMTSTSGDLQNLLSSEPLFFRCFLATHDSIL